MDKPPTAVVELEDKPCPLCGSSRASSYLRSGDFFNGVPGEFQIVRCLDCRHLYMNPRPTLDTILNCYPADYGPHQVAVPMSQAPVPAPVADTQTTAVPTAQRPWYLSPSVRRIPGLRALYYWLTKTYGDFIPSEVGPGSRAVELGCATGTFLEKLRAVGCQAEGVEPVASAAEEAKRRGFRVHVGTLESATLEGDSCDAAFAWMVIEHLTNPRETLLELKQVLRPDGWLVFSVPNAGCWEPYLFGRNWWCYELPRHLQHFTVARLKRLLTECGYDRISVIHQHNAMNLVISVGIVLRRWFPHSRWAVSLVEWPNHPTLWPQLALAPLAKVLAWLRQGGRLTIVARKPCSRAIENRGAVVS